MTASVARPDGRGSTLPDVQVYTPFRGGVPHLRPYVRELWARRHFAFELARAEIRTQNDGTGLGQLWLVLNPLMLTFVYYLLITIIRGGGRGQGFLAHIMAGLFLYTFFNRSVSGGASSILSSGRLVLNTAFPKMLLPISVVLVNFMRFLPTIGIYVVVHGVAGLPYSWNMLWGVVPLAITVVFATGFGMLFATLNLYFRDVKAFLPYVMRIWMYLSPVLWFPEEVPQSLAPLRYLNPLFPIIGTWSDAVVEGIAPNPALVGAGAAWAVAALVIGALALLSREREFAVRL